jgi:trimeric autotransporter adhesin
MEGNRSVNAVFVEIENILTLNTEGSGTVTANPSQGTYSSGTEVTLTASPEVGWTFDRWEGDLTGNTNPATITMDADKTVTAVFTQNSYTLTVTTTGNGTVAKTPDQAEYLHGTEVTLTATPSSGWVFDRWEGDLTGSTNPASLLMEGNRSVNAVFVEIENILTLNTEGSGTVTADPSQGTYSSGTEVTLTASPEVTGWTFDRWEGDLTGSSNPATITMDADKTVTAVFTQNNYTLTVTTTGNGTVAKAPDQAEYLHGSEVTLTATPSSGWVFDRWEGDLTGNTNPASILMEGNRSVNAVFVEIENILTLNTEGSGTVTADPSQGTYSSGTEVTLTASPEVGWTFDRWEGDLTGSSNPATITMDADKTVTAVFTQNNIH